MEFEIKIVKASHLPLIGKDKPTPYVDVYQDDGHFKFLIGTTAMSQPAQDPEWGLNVTSSLVHGSHFKFMIYSHRAILSDRLIGIVELTAKELFAYPKKLVSYRVKTSKDYPSPEGTETKLSITIKKVEGIEAVPKRISTGFLYAVSRSKHVFDGVTGIKFILNCKKPAIINRINVEKLKGQVLAIKDPNCMFYYSEHEERESDRINVTFEDSGVFDITNACRGLLDNGIFVFAFDNSGVCKFPPVEDSLLPVKKDDDGLEMQ